MGIVCVQRTSSRATWASYCKPQSGVSGNAKRCGSNSYCRRAALKSPAKAAESASWSGSGQQIFACFLLLLALAAVARNQGSDQGQSEY
jgi:hypothetical protein